MLIRSIRPAILATLVAAPVVLSTAKSDAGFTGFVVAYCSNNSDGSGACYGTPAGFRASSGQSDYENFWEISYPGGTNFAGFSATFQGVAYACSVPTSSSLMPTFLTAANFGKEFYVSWDASGNCNYLSLSNGSYYPAD
jgi:hypothetical protein